MEEFLVHFNKVRNYQYLLYIRGHYKKSYGFWETSAWYAVLEEYGVKLQLSYLNDEGKYVTYTARMDGEVDPPDTSGGYAFSCLQKYCHIPKLPVPPFHRVGAINETNPLYWSKRTPAYYYDKNSAYSDIMDKYPFPVTTKPLGDGIVERDQIGFTYNGDLCFEGEYARYRFPLEKDENYRRFARHYYELKANASDEDERAKYKGILNKSIGCLQNHNTFIRAYIVGMTNKVMRDLRDSLSPEQWIMINTDAIVTTVPLDLKVGKDIGEWKFKQGTIALLPSDSGRYQWDYEIPSVAGAPKGWWKQYGEHFDILKHPFPEEHNIYYFDIEEGEIKKYGKE